MAIGIIGAMEEEVEGLRSLMKNPTIRTIAHTELIEGTLDGKDVVLVKSGIGKVNAALSTTLLLSQYDIEKVINIGSAGGADESMEVGTVVISDRVTHHDMDATAFGYVPGQVPQMPEAYDADEMLVTLAEQAVEELAKYPSAKGLIASGDVFMSDATRVLKWKQQLLRKCVINSTVHSSSFVHFQILQEKNHRSVSMNFYH